MVQYILMLTMICKKRLIFSFKKDNEDAENSEKHDFRQKNFLALYTLFETI